MGNNAQLTQMGDLRRLEIFKAGHHQDENGAVDVYGVDDLRQMAESFNPKLSCPLAIGHVDSASPAYGWAKRVWVEGDRLFADIGECVSEVKDWLKRKFYNKVSIEVFPPDHMSNPSPGKWHLARICLLGAAPPAIAGGPPVVPFRFASASGTLKTYTYAAMENNKSPQDQIDDLARQIAELQLEVGKQEFAAPEDEMESLEMMEPDTEDDEELTFAAEEEDELVFAAEEDELMEVEDEEELVEMAAPMANPFIDELMMRGGFDLATASETSGVALDLINEAIAGGEPLSDEDQAAVMDALFSEDSMATFAANTKDMKQIQQLQSRLTRQEKELNKFSALVTAEHKLLQTERAELERSKVKAFAAQLVSDRKIRPSEEATTVELILNSDNTTKRTYAAGKSPLTHREALMQSYSDRAPLVDTSDIEAGGNDPAKVRTRAPKGYAAAASESEIHQAVRRRMVETGESFRDAYRAIANK